MTNFFKLLLLTLLLQSCNDTSEVSSIDPVNWNNRAVQIEFDSTFVHGSSYLSVYSQIYSQSEHKTHDLTVTVSMRNINKTDTLYIHKAEYFNTKGHSTRTYFDKTIFIAPMETVEIVIDEEDLEGGTGANFIFDWSTKKSLNEPFFEAIMISTSGQQGLSFTTHGKKII